MSRRKIVVSDHALNAFRRIIQNLKKHSLIGGEDARSAIIQAIRRIGVNPHMSSEKINLGKMPGEYRAFEVWDLRIVYRVEEARVVILDVLMKS